MSFDRVLHKICRQTAVYWGAPKPDGYGTASFDAPVEIKCRWEQRTEVITDYDGQEITSRARVYVLQDLDEKGYLYLGSLDDLDSDQADDPMSVEGAFSIKQFDISPSIWNPNVYHRTAYL